MLFVAASSLPTLGIMGVDVGGAIGHGIVDPDVAFEALVQAAGLSDIDGNPSTVLTLPGIDVVAGQWLEGGIEGRDSVFVLFSRLADPVGGRQRCTPGLLLVSVTE